MVEVFEVVKRRHKLQAAQRSSFSRRALQVAALLLGGVSLAGALLALAAWPAYLYLTQSLPPVERLEQLLDPQNGNLLQPTRFYDRSGNQLLFSLQPPGAPRNFVEAVGNRDLVDAFVASQQPDFWSASGPPLWQLSTGPQGIAEKLVARLLLADQPDGWVKTLRARLLAAEAERHYGRAQLLNWALNSADFGHWTFGVESAAELYFGKTTAELSLAQVALLAAVAQAPALNPIDTPELAVDYQHLVLSAMRDQGLITGAEFSSAFAEQLEFASNTTPEDSLNRFEDLALSQLQQQMGDMLQIGGLKVTTTLDANLQGLVESELALNQEATVIDPVNGQILALAGKTGQLHPIGSVADPFLYLDLFASGYSPAALVWDLPNTTIFTPADFSGPTTMRASLAAGNIAPVEDLLDELGQASLAETLAAFGLQQGSPTGVLQVASAFGVLADGGSLAELADQPGLGPTAILFAVDATGNVLLNWIAHQPAWITTPELAYLVTDVLADVSVRPSDTIPATIDGKPLAAFTGSAGDNGSWVVGYSSQRVVVLWGLNSVDILHQAWTAVFSAAHTNLPFKDWEQPAGLSQATVCVPSGQLPDEDCPQKRRELFLSGTAPNERDSLYQRIAVDSLNGKLATVFTPEQFVEDRLYLIVPQKAQAWARAAGIAQPPQDYDPIPALTLTGGAAAIAQPAPFSQMSGPFTILPVLPQGTVSFDIQVGQGLMPAEWINLSRGPTQAGTNPEVQWDTRGLSGVWAIQLQTWDEEGRLTRAYSIVSIEP